MRLSLDHLEAFVAAARAGSFSAAARRLGKAQSAVSTAVANLEIDLGVSLFDRGGKYPLLTEQGEVLLRDAQAVLARCTDLQSRAGAFSEQVDARIRLGVDEIVPQRFLVDVLERFSSAFPQTELELLYGTLKDVQTLVETERADLGLMLPMDFPDKSVAARLLCYLPYCPVASKGHPLAQLSEISPAQLEPHRQLVLTSRGGEREPDSVIFGSRTWMIESTQVIRELVRKSVGYAFLPRHMVEEDLAAGRLIHLPVTLEQTPHQVPVYLIWAHARPLGRAGQWLMEEFSRIDGA